MKMQFTYNIFIHRQIVGNISIEKNRKELNWKANARFENETKKE